MPETVVQHAVRALRLGPGEPIVLFSGEGGEFAAKLTVVGKNRATALIEGYSAIDRESTVEITLVQALTSNEKMDWIVQKAVEMGVTRILPVLMERSVTRLAGERAEKRREHWQAVAIAACEQCGRNKVPPVLPLSDLDGAIEATGDDLIVLSPDGAPLDAMDPLTWKSVALLVGPEGGFSDAEVHKLKGHLSVRLGPRILRTETAGLAGTAALQAWLGDWR